MKKVGVDAVNTVYAALGRILNDTHDGRDLLVNNAHIQQELSIIICRDLELICGHVDENSSEDDWMKMCNKTPLADSGGLCEKHCEEEIKKQNKGYMN